MSKAVILLSGGLDSATALAWAVKEKGWQCHTLSFDYGQRHRIELDRATKIAKIFDVVDHRIIKIDLASIGGSALTDNIDVPKDCAEQSGIPVTYVPARNIVFLSLAAALAETIEASHIVIGANIVDYSGYPDCRPEFFTSFTHTLALGTKTGVENAPLTIETPLLQLNKAEIIKMGLRLGVDYALTTSCYDPDDAGRPCGHCDSCHFRQLGFQEAGVLDPQLQ
ncbi:MAG: 7-cyano-7-deazaguanine synthase QueC [Mariprofundaceae bacterium]